MMWLFVLARVVANPFSNVFQKVLTRRAAGPVFVICATHGLLTLVCAPLLVVHRPVLQAGFWPNVWLCAGLAVAANALLVAAVRRTDLSVLGPINAYKAVVSLVPGAVLLGEVPRPLGLLGIGLIVAGSYFLADKKGEGDERGTGRWRRLLGDRGVQLRFAALVLSAVEAVFLKKALVASTPLATFAVWAVLGFAVSLGAVLGMNAFRRGAQGKIERELHVFRDNARPYLMLGLTTGVMQFCTLASFQALQVGPALALFQTSTLLTVILGHRLFRERDFARRMAGSLVMVCGAALIVVSR
jgi:drug/metabolite transporter (DMT)-like permease